MLDLILTVVVLAAAGAAAWWFMQKAAADRAAREREYDRERELEHQIETGLPSGIKSLCYPDSEMAGCKAMQVLDDGLAGNSPLVDNQFRNVFWATLESGVGMGYAFKDAMYASHWRAGSMGQVFDRLYSHKAIDKRLRDGWTNEALERQPHGYGTFTPDPGTAEGRAYLEHEQRILRRKGLA